MMRVVAVVLNFVMAGIYFLLTVMALGSLQPAGSDDHELILMLLGVSILVTVTTAMNAALLIRSAPIGRMAMIGFHVINMLSLALLLPLLFFYAFDDSPHRSDGLLALLPAIAIGIGYWAVLYRRYHSDA